MNREKNPYRIPRSLWIIFYVNLVLLIGFVFTYGFISKPPVDSSDYARLMLFFDFVTKPMTFVIATSALAFTLVNYLMNRKKYEIDYRRAKIDEEISSSFRMLETLIPRLEDEKKKYEELLKIVQDLVREKRELQDSLDQWKNAASSPDRDKQILAWTGQIKLHEGSSMEPMIAFNVQKGKIERIQVLAFEIIDQLKVISPESQHVYDYYNDIFQKTEFQMDHFASGLSQKGEGDFLGKS